MSTDDPKTSEKKLKLEGELSSTAGRLSLWKSLVEHPGWKEYHKMLESQRNERIGPVLIKPLMSMDEIPQQEFMKGEISGITVAQLSPFAQIEALESEVRLLTANLENENEYIAEGNAVESAGRVDGSTYTD